MILCFILSLGTSSISLLLKMEKGKFRREPDIIYKINE